MDRVFLDANVLFSAAYLPDAGVARLWTPGADLVTSAYALEEARRNLPGDEARERLGRLQAAIRVVEEAGAALTLPAGIRLPEKDVPILLAAVSARATHLVTGDVTHFGRYYGQVIAGVTILSPGDYLKLHTRTP